MPESAPDRPALGPDARLRDVYAHPLGRDILDKVALQAGLSRRWIDNPLIGRLRLRTLVRLSRGHVGHGFVDTLLRLLEEHPDVPLDDDAPITPAWWKEAVFYQVYPRSFADSDGDGIGDLRGIIDRLDHLVDLGVDALWLSPIYDSPNDDNGYDIRDYRAIGAEYGTMADFDELLEAVHARGMRLIMDLVVNHTSDEHEWFTRALADPDSPYRDYYFLRPGAETPDGVPPNNWTSFFSGSAWRHFAEQDLWGLHLFTAKQMDLDWEHAPLRAEIVDMVRWWLDKGVDGFRLDVINYISKQPGLPDGDAFVGELMGFTGVEHYFAGPRLHEHLRQLRAEAFEPYGAVTVGEGPGVGSQLGRLLTGDYRGELDLVFTFDQLEAPGKVRFDDYRYRLDHLRDHHVVQQSEWGNRYQPTVFAENHDNPRMISKVDPRPEHRTALGKLLATIQLTVRGTPFVYQGQELGMVNQTFSSMADLRDVESLNKYSELLAAGASPAEAFATVLAGSRDHARVPVQWDASAHGGFTTGEPWIRGDGDHRAWNMAAARTDPDSVLSWYRDLIALRRRTPALVLGSTEFTDTRRGRWVHRRTAEGSEALVVLNLTDRPQRVRAVGPAYELVLDSTPGEATRLGAYGARVYVRSMPTLGLS
jgi:oligo-1,6-glucosidase